MTDTGCRCQQVKRGKDGVHRCHRCGARFVQAMHLRNANNKVCDLADKVIVLEEKLKDRYRPIVLGQGKVLISHASKNGSDVYNSIVMIEDPSLGNRCIGEACSEFAEKWYDGEDPRLRTCIVFEHPDAAEVLIEKIESLPMVKESEK